jgi:pimeloyl-ACP methyl ester carboxylesterase
MEGELKTLKIRGLKTAWSEYGNKTGPLLVLLHGYPDTPEVWNQQIEFFKDRFHIIAPFTRGAQPSEPSSDSKRYGLNSSALDHLSILAQVDPSQKKPIVCVGHDMGGLQAWKLAGLLSKRCRALVMINSLGEEQVVRRLMNLKQQRRSWYIYPFMIPGVADRFAKRFPGKMLSMAHKSGGLSVKNRPQLSKSLAAVLHPLQQYRAVFSQIPGLAFQKPKRLNTPVFALYGRNDPFVVLPTTQEFERVCRRFAIRIIDGSHWIQKDQSELVNNMINEYITKELQTA